MRSSAHRHAAAGELVAYDLPAGPEWLDILAAHVDTGASFLPLDPRWTVRERRRVLDLARPALVVTADDEVLYAAGAPADPERSWAVVATSGTASDPKLAALPRAALGAAVAGSLDALEIGPGDPWVCCLTPAHVGGLLVLLRGVLGGAPVTVHERFAPDRLLREAPEGAHISLVPTMLRRLVDTGADLGRFGIFLVGGGALGPELASAAGAAGARVVSTYGMTETCGGVVYDGRPFPRAEVRVDLEGRIELRGPTLFDGYRADPAATGAVFTTDGWLRTRDLGVLDDGVLHVAGRADDAIRTGGETVWPDRVEAVLRTHPKVRDVAVRGVDDPEWGSAVGAWVVPTDPEAPPTLDDLREHCRDALARHEAPKALTLVDELPRTASGKIRRTVLR
ncbi:MAG: class I adenylate-forming enzyme family protein [Actinomycetota bacterium]